ncbi:MAG TPA: hypothetical protein VF828_05125 [Patescibacteria group bacterium]
MDLVKFLTPVNLDDEQKKFFLDPSYHPYFNYNHPQPEINLWLERQPHYSPLVSAVLSQDHSRIVAASAKIFCTSVDQRTLQNACRYLSRPPLSPLGGNLGRLKAGFESAFRLFNLPYHVVITHESGFNVHPMFSQKIVKVSRHLNFEYFSEDSQVKHEIVHILRFENGVVNNVPKSPRHLPTEEGLATFIADYKADYGHSALFQHAAEYAVTPVALKGSLRDMVDYLTSLGFSRDLAFARSVRHKYGFADTSRGGDILKPSMYFYHEQKIKKLSSSEILRLFVGKISLAELPLYPKYTGAFNPETISRFFNL